MKEKFVVIGAGSHSKVVAAAIHCCDNDIYAVFEEDEKKIGQLHFSNRIIHPMPKKDFWKDCSLRPIIAIGSNAQRKKIVDTIGAVNWGGVIHRSAIIHETATIGEGVYIGANVIIQPDATIGSHCIINTGAIIEHDVVVGDFCHIAPGSIVAGHAIIGSGTMLGAGTVVIPSIKIGLWCCVGAGSVVVKDIRDFQTAYGNPCRERISA